MSTKEDAIKLLEQGNELKVLRFDDGSRTVFVSKDFSYEKPLELDYGLAKELSPNLTQIKEGWETRDCRFRVYKLSSVKITTTELIEHYDFQVSNRYGNISQVDVALCRILKARLDSIRGLIETSSCAEEFHKGFRSTDVTDSGLLDMVAWDLMPGSAVFLGLVENAIKDGLEL